MATVMMIVKLTYVGAEFEMECAAFRPASTRLDHALVACDLTQIPAEGSCCRWGGGQLVSLITIHGGALLFDVYKWPPCLYICATPALCLGP